MAAAPTEPPVGPTLPPTTIDPCALLTDQEASRLAGTTLSAGKPETAASERLCVRNGAAGLPAVTVAVLDASAASEAQIAYQEAWTKVNASLKGFNPTPVAGLGDEAETLSFSMSGFSGIGIAVRKGKVFFDIFYEGAGGGPSVSALKSAASTALGRLP
jgi:hypothetical protein